MIDQLLTNVKQIAVIGLGYAGLPLLLTPDRRILLDLNVMYQPSDMAGFDGWRL